MMFNYFNTNNKMLSVVVAVMMIMMIGTNQQYYKVNGQDIVDRFYNYTYHSFATGSGDLLTSAITAAYTTSYNNQSLVLINDRYLFYPTIASMDPVENTNPINMANFFNYATVSPFSDTVRAMTQVDQYVYAAGYDSVYRLDLSQGINNSTLDKILDTSGAFYFGNRVYFVCSTTLFYFTHDANTPLSGTTPTTTLPLGTDQTNSWAVDTTNGLLFVGGIAGKFSIVNLNTNAVIGEYNPPANETGYARQATLIDTTKREIYSCASNTTELVTQMDVFTYPATMTSINDFVFNSTHALNDLSICNGGAYDNIQGQIFFIGPSSTSTRVIVGLGPRGEEQEIHYFYDDLQSLLVNYAWANPDTKQVSVITDTQIYTISYKSVCPGNCNDVGQCIDGQCICPTDGTYIGTYCEIKTCVNLNNCSSNGECSNGICNCDPNYLGSDDCSQRSCYYDCSGAGSCDVANNYTCICNEDRMGDYCQELAPPPECETISDSQDCVDHVYCGWCESSSKCLTGNRYGPAVGFCRTWYFNQNVEVGVIVLAAIFIGLIGLLFINDIISTIPLDMDRAKAYEVEFRTGTYPKATHEEASVLWWRDQRSSKAWTLMDQFQFISLISHMGVIFPSRFLHFTEFLDWTNLGIPFPSSISLPEETFPSRNNYDASSRTILTYAQYNNILESGTMYHLANILFWFGILCGAVLVPLGIVFLVLKFVESKVHWREVIRNRIIHCIVRLLTFGYIGVLMAASFSVAADPHSYKIIIPGAILIVLYGIGLPVAIWFILAVPESRLHNPTFKQQFGCLYVNFKPKTDHRFVVFSYIKRFFMAVIIGVLAFTPEPVYPLSGSDLAVPIVQAIVIALVIIGYAVLLIIRRPYFDHYHQWLEYLLAIINLATVGLCLSHIKSPSVAGELLVGLIQAIALVACIFAYIISWLQMRSTFLAKIGKIFSFCKCGKKDKTINMNNME